jgi:hypothetical protein
MTFEVLDFPSLFSSQSYIRAKSLGCERASTIMQSAGLTEWRKPSMIIAMIALIVSGAVASFEIWEALQPAQPPQNKTVTQTVTVSKGSIVLARSVVYINFTVPGNLVNANLNISFTGVEATSIARLSLLNVTQFQKFNTCNCNGNYSSLSTSWSSPFSHSYSTQTDVPYSAKWILAFQHDPGNGNTENLDETILLTYTLKS